MAAPSLEYGLSGAIPDTAVAAWGARLIVQQDGYVDFVPDRQDGDGPREHQERLCDLLDERFPPAALKATISDLLRGYEMTTREREDFVLYMDDDLVVVANTNGSAGYCYVAGWLQAPADQSEAEVQFTVTFTRSVTVGVPASLVPPGFSMPKRMRNLPGPLYDAVITAVPEALGQVNPDDFGDIESIADLNGDTSIGD